MQEDAAVCHDWGALCHLHLSLFLLEDGTTHTVGVWPSHSKPQHDTESAAGLADKQLLLPLPWCHTTIFLGLHVGGGCVYLCQHSPPPDTSQPFSSEFKGN